jgi:hypothetical protein
MERLPSKCGSEVLAFAGAFGLESWLFWCRVTTDRANYGRARAAVN